LVQVASDYKRGVENLTDELVSLFGQDLISMKKPTDLLRLKREVENKLVALETIRDNSAQKAMATIEEYFKKLKKSGGISSADYDEIEKLINRIKKGGKGNTEWDSNAVWEEFIAPINNDLDSQVNGWSAFFNQLSKSSPVIFKKIDGSKKYFIVGTYRPRFNIKDSFVRLVNLGVFGSPQRGADLLKRFISNNGKVGKTALQTYFRTVLVQTILPGIAFMFNYVTYALKEEFYQLYVDLQNKGHLSEEWDWRPEFYDGIQLWKKLTEDRIKLSFSEAFNDDILTWTYSDLIPAYNTYVDEVIMSIWSLINATEVSPEDVEQRVRNRETPTSTPTPTPTSDNNSSQPGSKQDLERYIGLTVTENTDGTFTDGHVSYKYENNKWLRKFPDGNWNQMD
jgi:hypothetical protein